MQSIMKSDETFSLPKPPGENATYNLYFRGPRFQCNTAQYNRTIHVDSHHEEGESLSTLSFESRWEPESLRYSVMRNEIANFSARRDADNHTSWEALAKTSAQICEAQSLVYNLSVKFPRGVQELQYSLGETEKLSA